MENSVILLVIAFISLVIIGYFIIRKRRHLTSSRVEPVNPPSLLEPVKFVLNIKTGEIHNIECRHVGAMSEKNKKLLTRNELILLSIRAVIAGNEDPDIAKIERYQDARVVTLFAENFDTVDSIMELIALKNLSVCVNCFKRAPLAEQTALQLL